MENTTTGIVEEIKERVEAQSNPYANGKGKAILEMMKKEKKTIQNNAHQDFLNNPELQRIYEVLKELNKTQTPNAGNNLTPTI